MNQQGFLHLLPDNRTDPERLFADADWMEELSDRMTHWPLD